MKLAKDAVVRLALPEGKTEAIFWDDTVPGLGLRLRDGGSRNWIFQFRIGRRQRRIGLGAATALSLADARATAAKLHARVKLGEDPAAAKAKTISTQDETFGSTLPAYLAHKAGELRPRSFVETKRALLIGAKSLHRLPLADVDRRRVARLLTGLTESSGPVASNRVRAALSTYFVWLMREGVADSNPILNTNVNAERARDRVLTDDELRAVWAATSGADQYSSIVRLLMLTGCRREEVGGLAWSEIDFAAATITLPPSRTKSARPFDLPLSTAALAILQAQLRSDREFVFGVRGKGFSAWVQGKAALDRRIKIEPWRLHDLRRSAATGVADIGFLPHVIEAVLNHQSGAKRGVAGIYNRSTYAAEKRQALARWGEHIAALSNIVRPRSRRCGDDQAHGSGNVDIAFAMAGAEAQRQRA